MDKSNQELADFQEREDVDADVERKISTKAFQELNQAFLITSEFKKISPNTCQYCWDNKHPL